MLKNLKRLTEKRSFRAHETHRMDELDGLPLASFRRRSWALLIDFLIVAILRAPFGFLRHHGSDEAAAGTFGWFMMEAGHKIEELAESVLYFGVALKLGKGQTPGKYLMGIRVMSLTHKEVGWWQSIERALGYGASLLEGGFGFVQYYINRNRQCVHDRIAETIVVYVRKPLARWSSPAGDPEK
jgi:uncharacterized RDD family membrane protein YckC